jgi:hypothetical protein
VPEFNAVLFAVITAFVGGLLVPWVKDSIDRRRERLDSSLDLVDTLATCLWTYWKFALRVAYYGRLGLTANQNYRVALEKWDSDVLWELGTSIQIKLSKAGRLLRKDRRRSFDKRQRRFIKYLDDTVDHLKEEGTPQDWEEFYSELMGNRRSQVDRLIDEVIDGLRSQRWHRRLYIWLRDLARRVFGSRSR